MKNMKPLNSLAIEAISIILAVILGFVVNEYRENRNNKARAESALEKITLEIEQNYALLKEKRVYYMSIIGAMDSLVRRGEKKYIYTPETIPGWTGINSPVLSQSSFRTAYTVGIFSFIDFQIAADISKVYIIQETVHTLGTMSLSAILSGDLFNHQSMRLLFQLYTEIINSWMAAADCVISKRSKI